MSKFSELASLDINDLPEVPIMPIGTYVWAIEQVPEIKLSGSGKSTLINFRCRCQEPIADFEGDPDELESFGDVSKVVRVLMFTIPEEPAADEDENSFNNRVAGAVQRVATFLTKHLGLSGSSIEEMLQYTAGAQFLGTIEHEQDNRDPSGEKMQDRLRRTAPLG